MKRKEHSEDTDLLEGVWSVSEINRYIAWHYKSSLIITLLF